MRQSLFFLQFIRQSSTVVGGQTTPQQNIVRCGVLAYKKGMCQVFDRWGTIHPLTELQIDNCQVVQVKTPEKHGYCALQIGAGMAKLKRVTKPMYHHFLNAGVYPKKTLCEFRVSPEAILPEGTEILARHFVPGQFVDVSGTTKGKGYAGGMKRWGFRGLRASHGVSVSHRSLGSTGACQDPGRVWKGKKMAGHMGHARRTVQGLRVYKIDCMSNSIFVYGCVPGPDGGLLEIRDARFKMKAHTDLTIPFPTYYPAPGDETVKMLEVEPPAINPHAPLGVELPEETWKEWQEIHLYHSVKLVTKGTSGAPSPTKDDD